MSELALVTGVGLLCAVGEGVAQSWAAIRRGAHGIRPLERYGDRVPRCVAATLPASWSAPDRWSWDGDEEPLEEIALCAAREAWSSASLGERAVVPSRIAIVLGTSGGGMVSRSRRELAASRPERRHRLLERSRPERCTALLADSLGIRGARLTVTTACTSSAQAVALAAELLGSGTADVVLAGGAEVVAAEFVAGFHAMGALSPGPCAPFGEPAGMTIGEGAAFLVLEHERSARERGARVLCAVQGYGLAGDAYHATAPDPKGDGMSRAIRAALGEAGLAPERIGYLNAHGTGTLANDAAECRAIARAFGQHATRMPVSSSKGHFGHTRGAAGAAELVVTALALRDQVVPPTLHSDSARAGASLSHPVVGTQPLPWRFDHAISQNCAFGGTNAAIVLSSAGLESARAHDAPEGAASVFIAGSGVLAPCPDSELLDWATGRSAGLPHCAPELEPATVARILRAVDTRNMDRPSRYLTAAAALALESAGVRPHGATGDRTGLVVGANRLPWQAAEELWDSIRTRGFAKASAPAFARLMLNAPAGAASRALGIRGPQSVVSGRLGSTLSALAIARWMLSRRRDADRFLVGSTFEVAPGLREDCAHRGEGVPKESAVCFLLARSPGSAPNGAQPVVHVAGCALGGYEDLEIVVGRALAEAKLRLDQLDLVTGAMDRGPPEHWSFVDVTELLGSSDAADGVALAAAVVALRSGAANRALVVASDSTCGSAAAVLTSA